MSMILLTESGQVLEVQEDDVLRMKCHAHKIMRRHAKV